MIPIHPDKSAHLARLEAMLQDDPSQQRFRLDRAAFTDEQLFELEMKYIFEGNWVYLAHESQIPNVNDFLTLHVGRQPVVITRAKDGKLTALMNTCTHRGATLCRHKKGNKSSFTCPFHGWTFSNTGKLLKVKDGSGEDAGYPSTFNCEGSHDLVKLGAFESYRGFLFGSVNPDVMPLAEYLGEATKIIDMIVDQTPEGLEVLKGTGSYYYDGNWKVQAENGADGYHVTATHWNYAATQQHRKEAGKDDIKAMSAGGWAKKGGGSYGFDNGHILLWTNWDNPEDRPLWNKREEWVQQFGEAKADWMLQKSRNLCLYPNVYFMDQFSSQIRVFRPISVNRTEVTIYCIAPKGEAPEARARRLRQYEDFFNATGMATPDDLEEFRACQEGYGAAPRVRWNEMNRGARHWVNGPDVEADKIGLKPLVSGVRTEDEGLYVAQHQHWLETMKKAVETEAAAQSANVGA